MFQTSPNETKTLGVLWNELTDELSISIPKFQAKWPQHMIR